MKLWVKRESALIDRPSPPRPKNGRQAWFHGRRGRPPVFLATLITAVDLGSTATIDQVVLSWEAAYATAFQIQTSGNASTWSTVYSTTAGTGGTQTLAVSGTGRYVRLYGTARATGYGYSLWKLQVYGTTGGGGGCCSATTPGAASCRGSCRAA